ncbi:MAG TPA: hypothetical protein PLN54_12740 [Flavobacteriales bacterium]|nr:hypothetical protein [Flavobacteriales bacterium]
MTGARYLIIIAHIALVTRVWAQHGSQHTGFLADTCTVSDTVYTIVEQMPEFPGGNEALFRFLHKSISKPECTSVEVPSSTIRLTFVVRDDGAVCDARVVAGADCEEAREQLISMLKSMPVWEPGRQRGKPVNVRYTLPVRIHRK